MKGKHGLTDLNAKNFVVVDMLSGNMGEIYVCHDVDFNIRLAVKTFQAVYMQQGDDIRQRFINEALVWVQLGTHPNIVQAFFVNEINERPYLFLEYIQPPPECSDASLRSLLSKKPLSLSTAIDFAIQICNGMRYALSVIPNFVFRDLKPANILIADAQIVKITDLGLVRIFDEERDHNSPGFPEKTLLREEKTFGVVGKLKDILQPFFKIFLMTEPSIIGTPRYMPPEQFRGEHLDQRSDIYSFGCVLYEMLTRRHLFSGGLWTLQKKHEQVSPKLPENLKNSLPDELEWIVLKCLEKSPDKRFQSFQELFNALCDVYKMVTHTDWKLTYEPQENESKIQKLALRVKNKFQIQSEEFWRFSYGPSHNITGKNYKLW